MTNTQQGLMYGGIGLGLLVLSLLCYYIIKRLLKKKQAIADGNYWCYQYQWLFNAFNNFDCAVYGFRGAGKDLIFALAIGLINEPHYSNIRYNDLTEVRDLKDLHVGGNQFEDFIDGNIKKFEPNFEEGRHMYISDAGVYLPSQYFDKLNKGFSEMPIHIALRRHLYNSHVHTNSQALNRVWDKLREQQGCFIHCLGTVDYGEFFIVSTITYTKYESALACLPPHNIKEKAKAKDKKTGEKLKTKEPDKYEILKHGEIVERRFKIPKTFIEYDTRHFKSILHKNKNSKKEVKA